MPGITQKPFSMRYVFFFTCVFLACMMMSCQKNDFSNLSEEASGLATDRSMIPTTGSPYFTARKTGVEHQTMTQTDPGDPQTIDCVAPPKDCVVILPTMISNDPEAEEFDTKISQGLSDELYDSGSGSLITELNTSAYNDVVSGQLKFYKFDKGDKIIYILR